MLKFTPCAHHDRHKLQKALTDIENLASELNKHMSTMEQRRRAKEIMAKMSQTISMDDEMFLIRKEDKMDIISPVNINLTLSWSITTEVPCANTAAKIQMRC